MNRFTTFALALGAGLVLVAPAVAGTPEEEFAAIQAKLQEVRTTAEEQPRMAKIRELYELAGGFLDRHRAAANDEQLTMAAGIFLEIAAMEQHYDAIDARLTELKALPKLPAKLGQAVAAYERKIAIRPGRAAPGWTGVDIHSGEEVTLEGLRGKLVLVDFWASWCPPCKSLMQKELAPLFETYGKDERFVLISLGMPWRGDTAEKQKTYADQNNLHWRKAFDASGKSGQDYGVEGIPFLCLVDEQGQILAVGSGWEVIGRVKEILAERLGGAKGE